MAWHTLLAAFTLIGTDLLRFWSRQAAWRR
jgi:hypothetical protein